MAINAKSFSLALLLLLGLTACKQPASEDASPFAAIPDSVVVAVGTAISGASFMALSGHLGKAMGAGGPIKALNYCNTKALPLTDSLSQAFQVSIKRTSLKNRNPENAPSEAETKVLQAFEQASGESPHQIGRSDKDITFYKPIRLAAPCLKCHGTPGEELATEVHATIQELYPGDKATGYSEGDLRGMWVVQFQDPQALQQMFEDMAPAAE